MQQDLQKAQQEITERAKGIPSKITTQQELRDGEALYVALNSELKKWEKVFKENIVDPAKKHYDDAKARSKKLLEPLADGKETLDGLLKAYRKSERERLEKEQAKIQKAFDKKVAKAEAKGEDPLDIPPPVSVQAPAKSSDTGEGKLIYRTVYDVEYLDQKLIPDHLCKIERTPIRAAIISVLRSGIEVPGCRLIEKEELASRGA